MKKYALILTLILTFALVSCGSESKTTSTTTDSTSVNVDTLTTNVDSSSVVK